MATREREHEHRQARGRDRTVKRSQLPSKELRDVASRLKGGYKLVRTGGGHFRVVDGSGRYVEDSEGKVISLVGNPSPGVVNAWERQLTEARAFAGQEPKKPYIPPEGVQARIDAFRRMREARQEGRAREATELRQRLTGLLSFMDHPEDIPGLAQDLAHVGARVAISQGKEGMTPDLLQSSARRMLSGDWVEPRYQEVWIGLCQRLEEAPDKVGVWYGLVRQARGLPADTVKLQPQQGEWPFRVELLPLDALFNAPEYQRPPSWSFIRREAARFDPALVGTIDVAQRSPRQYAILDGQQRSEIVRLVGKTTIFCSIYVGLDLASEARFFLHKNRDRKAVHPYYTFQAMLTARDQEAVEIERIVREHGYQLAIGVPRMGGEDQIAAIAAVMNAHSRQRPNGGGEALSPTLTLLRAAAYGREGGRNSVLIRGVARIFSAYGEEELDANLLQDVLTELGPDLTLGRARDLARSRGGAADIALAQVLIAEYDKKAGRGRKLGWERMLEPVEQKRRDGRPAK